MDNTAVARRGNPVGIASLVAGLLLAAVSLAVSGFSPYIPLFMDRTGLSFEAMALLYRVPQAGLAVLAAGLGIYGLLQWDRARVAAVIGTTLGASHLVIGVGGVLLSRVVLGLTG